jgi:predicted RND superfamily exporter protein
MCLLCSVAAVQMANMDINIFTQVGFVVLIGLACKNAILIVEFAKAQREQGHSRYQATLEACKLRLRPIVMTSFAFILGVVPLVLSVGAGAEMRRTLGTAVFGGMLGVTLFGIFLTPVFYYVIQWFTDLRTTLQANRVTEGRSWMPQFGRPRRKAAVHSEADPFVHDDGHALAAANIRRHDSAGIEAVSEIAGVDGAATALADEAGASGKPR